MPANDTRPLALYARVSTADQHAEVQLHALRQYATNRGLPALEYVDNGISGAQARRPALDQMLAAVRRREVQGVVITKLDRLGRSSIHLGELAEEFQALDMALVILDSGIDTTTLAGRLTYQILAAMAEFERGLIRERTRAGLAAARRRGVRLGRPPIDRKTKQRIVRLRRTGGHTHAAIAELVGVSVPTVERVLRAARRATAPA